MIEDISLTEELVLNPEYAGERYARIEVYVNGKKFPIECGYIRVKDNDILFEELRERLEQ